MAPIFIGVIINNSERRCLMTDGEIGLTYLIVVIVTIVIASMMMKKG
jgi:hypothetical protein